MLCHFAFYCPLSPVIWWYVSSMTVSYTYLYSKKPAQSGQRVRLNFLLPRVTTSFLPLDLVPLYHECCIVTKPPAGSGMVDFAISGLTCLSLAWAGSCFSVFPFVNMA